MADFFENDHVVSITPSDTTNLEPAVKRLYIGGTGAVEIETVSGESVTFAAVPVGIFEPGCRIKKVKAGGTVATNIIGLY